MPWMDVSRKATMTIASISRPIVNRIFGNATASPSGGLTRTSRADPVEGGWTPLRNRKSPEFDTITVGERRMKC